MTQRSYVRPGERALRALPQGCRAVLLARGWPGAVDEIEAFIDKGLSLEEAARQWWLVAAGRVAAHGGWKEREGFAGYPTVAGGEKVVGGPVATRVGRNEEEGLAGDPKVDGRVDIPAVCMQIRAAAYSRYRAAAAMSSAEKDAAAYMASAVLPCAGKVGVNADAAAGGPKVDGRVDIPADDAAYMAAAVQTAKQVGADAAA